MCAHARADLCMLEEKGKQKAPLKPLIPNAAHAYKPLLWFLESRRQCASSVVLVSTACSAGRGEKLGSGEMAAH